MDIFNALAQPTRRTIIEMLSRKGQLTATVIADHFQMSASAISQHLKILRESGLLRVQRQGQLRLYQINPEKMSELEHWAKKIAAHWSQRFDRLEMVLEEEKRKILNTYTINKKK